MNNAANLNSTPVTTTVTRVGKIGRLPRSIRDELGRRIDDGRPGTEIVKWLNEQPGVQAVLAEFFNSRPITEQNLSEWKQSGHLEWLRRREACEAAQQLVESASDLDESTRDTCLSDRFATVLTAEMTRLAMALLDAETDLEKRWKRLTEILGLLSQLRRDDHRAVTTAIRREQWQREAERQAEEDEKRKEDARKRQTTDMLLQGTALDSDAELLGGGPNARKLADLLYRIKFDLPTDDLDPSTAYAGADAEADDEAYTDAEADADFADNLAVGGTQQKPTKSQANPA